jgi:hypothetical protein
VHHKNRLVECRARVGGVIVGLPPTHARCRRLRDDLRLCPPCLPAMPGDPPTAYRNLTSNGLAASLVHDKLLGLSTSVPATNDEALLKQLLGGSSVQGRVSFVTGGAEVWVTQALMEIKVKGTRRSLKLKGMAKLPLPVGHTGTLASWKRRVACFRKATHRKQAQPGRGKVWR